MGPFRITRISGHQVPFILSPANRCWVGLGLWPNDHMFMILVNRPGKSGGSWELSSKKIFGLKEKYLAQIIFCESHNSKLMKVERAKTLFSNLILFG
jgi:hypothetical protein